MISRLPGIFSRCRIDAAGSEPSPPPFPGTVAPHSVARRDETRKRLGRSGSGDRACSPLAATRPSPEKERRRDGEEKKEGQRQRKEDKETQEQKEHREHKERNEEKENEEGQERKEQKEGKEKEEHEENEEIEEKRYDKQKMTS